MKPLEETTTGFETVYQISAFIYSTQKFQYRKSTCVLSALYIHLLLKYEVITVHPPTVQEMYAFCHEALADYVDSFETYANFKELV